MPEPRAARPAPLALAGWLPAWDIERRRADVGALVDWALAELRQLGVRTEALDDLALDPTRARAAAQHLTQRSLSLSLRAPLHRALRQLAPELPWGRVWAQTYTHFRILTPDDPGSAVPPHTDYGYAHGLEERNVWLPLTDARGTAALHLLPLRESLEWLHRSGDPAAQFDLDRLRPEETALGQCLLFTPLHLHGARPPSGGARVSVDLRLVPAPPEGVRPDATFAPLAPEVEA